MASNVSELIMDIAASLWMVPATLEELHKREFVQNMSEHSLWILVNSAKRKGWIYEDKSETYHTYRKTVKEVLNPKGYELDIDKYKKLTR